MGEKKGMSAFGAWLHTNLEECGMKQRDFAKIFGLSEVSVSRYISGEREPSLCKLQKILDYFGCHIVFDRNDDPVITNTETQVKSRSINLRQLLFYMTEGDIIQICDGHDGWDAFTEFHATSKLLDPFMDRRIICMGAEETNDGCAIRVELAD
jgi:transcriptional regulator with XRE-family HTH domain